MQFHGSATECKLEPFCRITLQIEKNFIPDLVIIRKLESYVYTIGVEFVDWIIL